MTTLESSRLTATELEVWQVIKEKIVGGDLRKIYLEFLLKPLNDISDDMCRGALNTLEKFVFTGDYNWGGNNGPYAGRTIDHLHTHIIPRFENDVPNPVGGIRWIIPGRANYKK